MCVVPGRLRDLAFCVYAMDITVCSAITTPFTELRFGVNLIVKARSTSTALMPQTRQSGISPLLILFSISFRKSNTGFIFAPVPKALTPSSCSARAYTQRSVAAIGLCRKPVFRSLNFVIRRRGKYRTTCNALAGCRA